MVMAPQSPLYLQPNQVTAAAILNRLILNSAQAPLLDLAINSPEWDTLNSLAVELAQTAILPAQVQNRIFTVTATGSDLDAKADERGVPPRNQALQATGVERFFGPAGTVIHLGTRVGTGQAPQRLYSVTDADTPIPVGGFVDLNIRATQGGTAWNQNLAGVVVVMVDAVAGVTCTNQAAIAGGTDQETDDVFRARILAAAANPGASANNAEVQEWALAVSGVGGANISYPQLGSPPVPPGCIRISLVDTDQLPASATVVEAVRDYISQPWRDTIEANTLALGGAGATLDATQADSTSTSEVKLAPDAAPATAYLANLQTVLQQPGPWEVWLRCKVGVAQPAAPQPNLLQVELFDTTAGVDAGPSALVTTPAIYTMQASQLPVTMGLVYFGDVFCNLLDTLQLRITRLVADPTSTVWVDQVFLRSAMQRVDIKQKLPGGWRLYVQPATQLNVDVVVSVVYAAGATPASVNASIRTTLANLMANIPFGTGLNQYLQVGAVGDTIFNTVGVASYTYNTMLVNGSQQNILVLPEQKTVLRYLTVNGVAA